MPSDASRAPPVATGPSRSLRALAVFCGSLQGDDPVYMAAARDLGGLLARRGIDLVYGGGRVGLMGAVADGALADGGTVIGVIPQSLVDRELAHRGVTDLRITGSMHERKDLMASLADGFIALPGGAGRWTSCSRPGPGRCSASTSSHARSWTWRASTRACGTTWSA